MRFRHQKTGRMRIDEEMNWKRIEDLEGHPVVECRQNRLRGRGLWNIQFAIDVEMKPQQVVSSAPMNCPPGAPPRRGVEMLS